MHFRKRNCLINHVMTFYLCFVCTSLCLGSNCKERVDSHCVGWYFLVSLLSASVCIVVKNKKKKTRFQTSAPGLLVNSTVMSKLNTNSFLCSRKMVGSQKISVDNNRGKWGARVTVPLQLEGSSALLALRQSLRVYRPKVQGRQIPQEKTPQLPSLLSLCYKTLESLESRVSVFVLPARFLKDHPSNLRWRCKVLLGLIILPKSTLL